MSCKRSSTVFSSHSGKDALASLGMEKLDLTSLKNEIVTNLENGKHSYVIYACDARTLLLFAESNKYIYEPYHAANKILSDGRPIYWLVKSMTGLLFEQITGPGLMNSVLEDEYFKNKRHMFYGGTPETISALRLKCKMEKVNLVSAESPPFLDVDELDVSSVNRKIKDLDVDFFWCGLGAPKQEYLIYQLDKRQKTVMIGVGLAFDYYAGIVKESPTYFSKFGLEWMVRYAQQPKRIRRFIRPFFFVLTLLVMNLFKRDK